jgi:uncharacterized protein (TIGR02147 family)
LHFQIIADWEHYAILSLAETENFQTNTKWIAKRLNISELKAQTCIDNLIQAKLISVHGKKWNLTHQALKTTEDVSSVALRKARKQDLIAAMNAIDEVSVGLRDLSACTVALDPADLFELKELIRDFRKRFMKNAERNSGVEVYKLAIQLFPLSKVSENEIN